jgi:hypothetical protein
MIEKLREEEWIEENEVSAYCSGASSREVILKINEIIDVVNALGPQDLCEAYLKAQESKCSHRWVTQYEAGKITGEYVCIRCNEKLVCEHSWVDRLEENGKICVLCGIIK